MEGHSSPVLSLQWHQHPNTVVSLLDSLWERQELVDVTLAADGQFVDVHRIVLCACSKYFQELLTNKRNVEKHTIIYLKDVSYCNLKALVDYMYKGEVRIDGDQLQSFLDTAKSLGIRGLMNENNKASVTPIQRKRTHSVDNEATSQTPMKCEQVNQCQDSRDHLTEPSSDHSDYEEEELDLLQSPQDDYLNDTGNSQQGPSQQLHQEMHIPNQELAYGDHHVGWQGANNSASMDHYNLTNSTDTEHGRHSCPRCGRSYKWKQTLLRHVKYECGVEPQFVCPVCRATFHHRNVLQRHMNLHNRPK